MKYGQPLINSVSFRKFVNYDTIFEQFQQISCFNFKVIFQVLYLLLHLQKAPIKMSSAIKFYKKIFGNVT